MVNPWHWEGSTKPSSPLETQWNDDNSDNDDDDDNNDNDNDQDDEYDDAGRSTKRWLRADSGRVQQRPLHPGRLNATQQWDDVHHQVRFKR